MTYYVIKGTYQVIGSSPDADSVKFKARSKDQWSKIETDNRERLEKNLKKDEVLMMRFQGVDALETHYSPPPVRPPSGLSSKIKQNKDQQPKGGDHHQSSALGDAATAAMLKLLGVHDEKWRRFGKNRWIDKATINGKLVDEKGADNIPGYVVTSDVERNGRPIAWLFTGTPPERDGSSISVDELAERIESSVNYQLVRQGVVYPYFFMTLPAKLRLPLANAATQARADAKSGRVGAGNVWQNDKTLDGVRLSQVTQLHEELPIYPYLFRKILKHWYKQKLEKFWSALQSNSSIPDPDDMSLDMETLLVGADPYMFVSSDQDFVRLSTILSVTKQTLHLHKSPEDLVFLQ